MILLAHSVSFSSSTENNRVENEICVVKEAITFQ